MFNEQSKSAFSDATVCDNNLERVTGLRAICAMSSAECSQLNQMSPNGLQWYIQCVCPTDPNSITQSLSAQSLKLCERLSSTTEAMRPHSFCIYK